MTSLPLINPFHWGFNGTVTQYVSDDSVSIPLKNTNEKTNFKNFVSQNVPGLANGSNFKLKPYLFTGILQTVYLSAANLSAKFPVFYGREIRQFSDNGIASVDWVMDSWESKYKLNLTTGKYDRKAFDDDEKSTHPENWPRLHPRTRFLTDQELVDVHEVEKPLVLVLHGLAGGSHEPIIRSLTNDISRINNNKFQVAVLNCRGCSRTKISDKKLFTALFTDDINGFLVQERKRHPKRKIYAVGFSFGATQLANYLGKHSNDPIISSAVFLCNPWDMVKSAEKIRDDWWSNILFSKSLAVFLYKMIKSNFNELEVPENTKPAHTPTVDNPCYFAYTKSNLKLAEQATSTIQFDDIFTAPCLGLSSAFEYYSAASSNQRIADFKIPTLLINSTDDPVTGDGAMPRKEALANPNTILIETDLGGHLAYLDSENNSWITGQISQFFNKFDELAV